MKNRSFIAIAILAVLLALTACQPRYIIFPLPGDDIGSNNVISINSIDDLKNAANAPDGSQLMLNGFSIDTKTAGLPITFANNVKVSGSIDITEGTSTFMSRSTDEPSVVIFRIEGSASVDIADLTVKVAESIADTIKGIVEVTTGTLNASNYNVVTVDSTGNTSSSKTTAGIAIGAGAEPEKIQVSDSSVSVTIDTSLDASDFNESFDNVGTGDSGITITTPYDAKDATELSAVLAEYGKARLTADYSADDIVFTSSNSALDIDLNGHALSIVRTGSSLEIPVNMTFRNGSLTTRADGATTSTCSVFVTADVTLTLDGINYDCGPSGIYAKGANSKIVIKNSTITATGAYAVGTNASVNAANVSYEIIDSILVTEDADSVPVFLNVPGNFTISGSTIIGGRQVVMLRGASGTISDSTVVSRGDCIEDYDSKDWGTGNFAPSAAVLVGNRSAGSAYDNKSEITLDDVTLLCGEYDAETGAYTPNTDENLYLIYAASDNDIPTTITLKGSSAEYADGIHYWGKDITVNGTTLEDTTSGQ